MSEDLFSGDKKDKLIIPLITDLKFTDMKKVIVIGCPGSGKSTFAKKLCNATGLTLYHLDLIYHKPDRTTVSREEFDTALSRILEKDAYIIDGNYGRTIEVRIKECDTVFLFDLPTEVCLEGVLSRIGKKRDDMPWVEECFDPEFEEFIKGFKNDKLQDIYGLLRKFSDKKVIIFKSHDEADEYLSQLSILYKR